MRAIHCAWLGVLAACGSDGVDPCDGVGGTCITLTIKAGATPDRIDRLEVDLHFGTFLDVSEHVIDAQLPAVTAIQIGITSDIAERTTIGVASKLAGSVIGTGWIEENIEPNTHTRLELELRAPTSCTANSLFCGDGTTGAKDTLYKCVENGIPLSRGRCQFGCAVDRCSGGTSTCVKDGFYCGGNKVEGDPQQLYTCVSDHMGTPKTECPRPRGCVIKEMPKDDACTP